MYAPTSMFDGGALLIAPGGKRSDAAELTITAERPASTPVRAKPKRRPAAKPPQPGAAQ